MDEVGTIWRAFQSTLPRRERPAAVGGLLAVTNPFNPRSRVGSDANVTFGDTLQDIFQSTLPRRERPGANGFRFSLFLFQSTLPRRERRQPG